MPDSLATGSTLTCAWAGRPNWVFHHMGLGETIGFGTQLTMNNTGHYDPTNESPNRVHINLLGDPSLRMTMMYPPGTVSCVNAGGSTVNVSWGASSDAQLGYHVYRFDNSTQNWVRRTTNAVTTTAYADNVSGLSGTVRYMVRALKLQTTPSGTYYNLSLGTFGQVILGGGVVGTNAAAIALGMGADVTIIERSTDRMEELVARFGISTKTLYSTQGAIEDECATADLVIGGVLIPGAAAPKLVTKKMLKDWKPGSVFVDVAIDQGGCAETSKATTHADPTYVVDGVIHYCVANMPGGVARTSTFALNNVTLPFAMAIANKGWKKALADDVHLKNGLNVALGKVTYKAVADDLGYAYVPADRVIAG